MNARKIIIKQIVKQDRLRQHHQDQLNQAKRYLSIVLQKNQCMIIGALVFAGWIGWRYIRQVHVSTLLKSMSYLKWLRIIAYL